MIKLGDTYIRIADGRLVVLSSIIDELTPYAYVMYRVVGTPNMSKEIPLEIFLDYFRKVNTDGS